MKRGIGYLLALGFAGILVAIFFPVFATGREKARAAHRRAGGEMLLAVPSSSLARQEPESRTPTWGGPPAAARPPASPQFVAPVARAGQPVMMASLGGAAAPASVPPLRDPDMYLSNTYMGGGGARDRLEALIQNGVVVDG